MSSNLTSGISPFSGRMTDEQLNDLFIEFWADSYPHVKPGVHAISTHVAFARQVLDVYDLMQLAEPVSEEDDHIEF